LVTPSRGHLGNLLIEENTGTMLAQTLQQGVRGGLAGEARYTRFRMGRRNGGTVVNFYAINADMGHLDAADCNFGKVSPLGRIGSAAAEWGRFNIRARTLRRWNARREAHAYGA
jgi:hypothetical protein